MDITQDHLKGLNPFKNCFAETHKKTNVFNKVRTLTSHTYYRDNEIETS